MHAQAHTAAHTHLVLPLGLRLALSLLADFQPLHVILRMDGILVRNTQDTLRGLKNSHCDPKADVEGSGAPSGNSTKVWVLLLAHDQITH